MAFSLAMPFHEGETKMHKLLNIDPRENTTQAMLTPQAAFRLQHAPLLAVGTLDADGRPWTSLWGGKHGFSEMLGGGIVGTRTLVDGAHDPVVQALMGRDAKGEMVQGQEKMISALTIDLMVRKRVKIFGHMVAGCLNEAHVQVEDRDRSSVKIPEVQNQMQLITKIKTSLGNCPKYLNQYEIRPALVTSKLISQGDTLSREAKELILKSDMFFLTTSSTEDMDTNHRGGPSGFVRILSDTEFVYPEYSGNRLYNSLGNLLINPRIGITFPNYETGDVLYITGSATILVTSDAAAMLPGSNLAVKITIEEFHFVKEGLSFRGERKTPSPYNPLVRTLASEGNLKGSISDVRKTARLIKKVPLAHSVTRFTFSVPEGVRYSPGQWAAFDFSGHLNHGYSHMRDDDPRSLNDDFVRTFTISSTPSANGHDNNFDITIRNVGVVTDFLLKQNADAEFQVPIVGVDGDFKIQQDSDTNKLTPFIAGGVGITPLLGQLGNLTMQQDRFRLLWTTRLTDVDLVLQTLQENPELAKCAQIFFTGSSEIAGTETKIEQLQNIGAEVLRRRLQKTDLDIQDAGSYYLCAGGLLRTQLLAWLEGKVVIFENFDY